MSALVAAYRETRHFKSLAPETLRKARTYLDEIDREFGSVILPDAEHKGFVKEIEDWRDKFDSASTADAHVKQLRTLFNWAVKREDLGVNRTLAVEAAHTAGDYSAQLWTDEEIAAFLTHADPHIGFALRLAHLTGMRQTDLCAVLWSADKGSLLEWATSKSRAKRIAYVPVTADLRALLAEIPKRAATILTGARGLPLKPSRLRDEFAATRKTAGVEKRWHDLRGNAATRLMGLNLSDREIGVVMGVSEKNVAQWRRRYVADRQIAEGVVVRLSEHRRVK